MGKIAGFTKQFGQSILNMGRVAHLMSWSAFYFIYIKKLLLSNKNFLKLVKYEIN